MFKFRKKRDLALEESLGDDWVRDLGVTEAPLNQQILFYLGVIVFLVGLGATVKIILLAFESSFYKARALANLSEVQRLPAPRGIIYDARGKVLAENRPVFLAFLNVREFLRRSDLQNQTLKVAGEVLGISADDFWHLIEENNQGVFSDTILLNADLSQSQLIKLESLDSTVILVSRGFDRHYPQGPVFASVVGYTGIASAEDLKRYPNLGGRDFVGKAGLEAFYENKLRGKPGTSVKVRDARGNVLDQKKGKESEIGQELHLTIDADFQTYFYSRLKQGLESLGRKVGVGLAIDPRDGRVLAMVNLPSYDNGIFNSASTSKAVAELLSAPLKPLFNRAIGGLYSPGSTIKPLHAIAALSEGVITPEREIFSPGYLDVPNPYNPDEPTRFLDWRYQGQVNLASALAQSSNVYFYIVGGGSPPRAAAGQEGVKGLGINKLKEWWQKFGLGIPNGIDLFGEAAGSLPDALSREKKTGKPWLLGDTYNVAIGQGDLLVTPLQLLSYIGAVANGGEVYQTFLVNGFHQPKAVKDLSAVGTSVIKEVQKGMERAVTSPLGTAYALHDLPFKVAAKTGSAQIRNNSQENAFFVGYAPAQNPEISILVLVENSKEGSLNAVPIAKDVLDWYYLNRMTKVNQENKNINDYESNIPENF
ncbi:MAG: hypothetical protein HY093_04785 [Candidatus Liptonbacteria bacterium]|nr:hypothetical protein [Candidatus Liptonbacteria bacterium]